MTSVHVEADDDESGESWLLAKFSDTSWELNVRAPASDFLMLRNIRTFGWETRRAVKVGVCAGASTFWASDGETATLMVGEDDETWDVAVSLSVEVIDDLVQQVARQAT